MELGGGTSLRPKKRAWGTTLPSRMSPLPRRGVAPQALSGTEEEEGSFIYYSNMDEEIISSESATMTRKKTTIMPVASGGSKGTASINWCRTCVPSSPRLGTSRPV
jgi:hypothetical protein